MFPFVRDPDGCLPAAPVVPVVPPVDPGTGITPDSGVVEAAAPFFSLQRLAMTGADIAVLVSVALAVLVLGVLLVLVARRRRRRNDDDTTTGTTGSARSAGAAVLGLLLILGLSLGGGTSSAHAATDPVDVVTECEFLDLSGITVSTEPGDGLMPGESYDVVTATITNTSTKAVNVFLSTELNSDPQGIAPFTALSAQTATTLVYTGVLGNTTDTQAVRVPAGESVTLLFRASVSGSAGNPQQAARVVFDIVITAIEAA